MKITYKNEDNCDCKPVFVVRQGFKNLVGLA